MSGINDSLLNPSLYRTLVDNFGRVMVSGRGTRMIDVQQYDAVTNKFVIKRKKGEYYRISCPFCNDKQKRLWVSYMFGVNGANWDLADCFNEQCLEDPINLLKLRGVVERRYGASRINQTAFKKAKDSVMGPEKLIGNVIRLDKLREGHPARRYIRDDRNFDPDRLAERFKVGWCQSCENERYGRVVENRIIFPIKFNGSDFGYQARTMYERESPKYFTCPGMTRGNILFNFDYAKKYSTIVICEGLLDAMRVGPNAVAVLAIKPTFEQLHLLKELDLEAIVILLDSYEKPKVKKAREARGEDHSITRTVNELKSMPGMSAKVIDIWLENKGNKKIDAGSFTTQKELHREIYRLAGKRKKKFQLKTYKDSIDADQG